MNRRRAHKRDLFCVSLPHYEGDKVVTHHMYYFTTNEQKEYLYQNAKRFDKRLARDDFHLLRCDPVGIPIIPRWKEDCLHYSHELGHTIELEVQPAFFFEGLWPHDEIPVVSRNPEVVNMARKGYLTPEEAMKVESRNLDVFK